MTHATTLTPAEIGGIARRIDRPVVLVGLMGVGKSTVGRRLAARLGVAFVDADEEVVEVDEEGNSMSAGVSVEYSWGMGWVDSWRKNPLTVIGVLFAMILLPIVATITWKTSLAGVWAGGACASGGDKLTVTAVAQGRDAAEDIHLSLSP